LEEHLPPNPLPAGRGSKELASSKAKGREPILTGSLRYALLRMLVLSETEGLGINFIEGLVLPVLSEV
jgi:hypothetical protein